MTWSGASNAISALSALISVAALGISWSTASKETYRDQIDARISNCVSAAGLYAAQSWDYGRNSEPDGELEDFSHKALMIGRAAQLCRNKSDNVASLKTCMADHVDSPEEHMIPETSKGVVIGKNLVC
jgi:acyl-coenzyme A synthetase/AMP-(fatty) acid ligase